VTSAFPALYGARVWLCLVALALITAANLWGVAESARLFIVPTVLFIAAIAVVIIGGLVRSHPAVAPAHNLPSTAEAVGVMLILKAFASGCSALTGVEAIANAVPSSESHVCAGLSAPKCGWASSSAPCCLAWPR